MESTNVHSTVPLSILFFVPDRCLIHHCISRLSTWTVALVELHALTLSCLAGKRGGFLTGLRLLKIPVNFLLLPMMMRSTSLSLHLKTLPSKSLWQRYFATMDFKWSSRWSVYDARLFIVRWSMICHALSSTELNDPESGGWKVNTRLHTWRADHQGVEVGHALGGGCDHVYYIGVNDYQVWNFVM